MADPQALLWQFLNGEPQGLHFVREYQADGFVLHFYCEAAHLGVEIDDNPFKPDGGGVRERWQEQHRVDIMQVPPAHILRNASEVAEAIVDIATRRRARFAG